MLGQYAGTAGDLLSALGPIIGPRTRRAQYSSKVQQRPHRTSAFAILQMRPDQRKRGYRRLLRGVRDEAVVGSNRAGIVQVG